MSRPALPIPPVLAFAARDGASWGVAAGGDPARVALGRTDAGGPADVAPGELRRGTCGQWEVRRNGEAVAAVEQPADATGENPDQGLSLVQVAGPAEGAGIAYAGQPDAQADSARILFAWFPEDRTIALLAVRPAKAKGQDRDELAVSCLGEPPGNHVFDPRLSSTYGGDGLLRRVGVELWLGESEESDLRPLRVAGEGSRAVARLDLEDAVVQAQPFLAHSRGQSGIGVYVLITRP
ncbi:MAG TPA: hypothetical protein VG321_07210 [Solirubrobacteraceae bacterium]|nr:hypothetical protein [Solirubrobacteraceae bacterium]